MTAPLVVQKTCRKCGLTKPAHQMKRDKRYSDGMSSYCTSCHKAYSVAWQKANRGKHTATRRAYYAKHRDRLREKKRAAYSASDRRNQNLPRLYRMMPSEYVAMLAAQDGKCKICKRSHTEFSRALAVDHDHKCCPSTPTCGACTRGLLCDQCNTSLHAMERDDGWLAAALAYLGERK